MRVCLVYVDPHRLTHISDVISCLLDARWAIFARRLQYSPFSRVWLTYLTSTPRACNATVVHPRRPRRRTRRALPDPRGTSQRGRARAAVRASSVVLGLLEASMPASSCRVADGQTVCRYRTSDVGRWKKQSNSLEARTKCIWQANIEPENVLYNISRRLYRGDDRTAMYLLYV